MAGAWSGRARVLLSLSDILEPGIAGGDAAGGAPTGRADRPATLAARSTGRSPGQTEDLVRPASGTHLIWPALSTPASASSRNYFIYNPWTSTVRATWYGFDSNGRLAVTHEQDIPPEGGGLLNEADFSSTLPEGGHWETMSARPLEGVGWSAVRGADLMFSARSFTDLQARCEYPARLLFGLGDVGKIWLVNPGSSVERVAIALLSGSRVLGSQEVLLAPHGGAVWSAEAFAGAISWGGPTGEDWIVVIQSMRGALAIGLLEEAAGSAGAPSGEGRERVTLGDPIP